MDASVKTNPDLAILKSDLDELKRDMAGLVRHLKSGATHTIDTIGNDAREEVSKVYGQMSDQSKKTLGEVVHQIDEHPTLSAVIALGAAFMIFRMFSR